MTILTLDYSGVPLPDDITEVCRKAYLVARVVPSPLWTHFGQIAEVIGSGPRGVGRSMLALCQPRTYTEFAEPHRWLCDWTRVRDWRGVRVSPKDEEGTEITRLRHLSENALYVAQGGRMVDEERAHPAFRIATPDLRKLARAAGIA